MVKGVKNLLVMLLVHVSSVRHEGISIFRAQKIALKKSMKFTRFIIYFLLKSHKTKKFQEISTNTPISYTTHISEKPYFQVI